MNTKPVKGMPSGPSGGHLGMDSNNTGMMGFFTSRLLARVTSFWHISDLQNSFVTQQITTYK